MLCFRALCRGRALHPNVFSSIQSRSLSIHPAKFEEEAAGGVRTSTPLVPVHVTWVASMPDALEKSRQLASSITWIYHPRSSNLSEASAPSPAWYSSHGKHPPPDPVTHPQPQSTTNSKIFAYLTVPFSLVCPLPAQSQGPVFVGEGNLPMCVLSPPSPPASPLFTPSPAEIAVGVGAMAGAKRYETVTVSESRLCESRSENRVGGDDDVCFDRGWWAVN